MRLALLILVCLTTSAAAASDRVSIGAFSIDRTEVTIQTFAHFAARAGLVTKAEREGGGFEFAAGWQRRPGWTFRTPFGTQPDPHEPAVHVTHDEAARFCADRGGRLPTRDEWTRAAYSETRTDAPAPFVTGETYPYPVGREGTGMNNNRTSHVPVATTKRGVNGLYDMGGNAWEWLADRRDGDALTAGGSWWYGPEKTRESGMQWKPADFTAVYIGFRCAYDAAG